MKSLVVTNPFGGREIGHRITDPEEIRSILAGEHAHHVVPASHPDAAIVMSDAPEIDETTTEEA